MPAENSTPDGLLAQPIDSQARRNYPAWLAVLFLGLCPLAMGIDLPARQWLATELLPSDLRRLLTWSELFAHGLGAAVLLVTVYVLDPARRRRLPRVVAIVVVAGLLANLAKLLVARFRPNHFTGTSIQESFAGWLPSIWPIAGHSALDHRLQSFPSGHAALATGFAFGLASVYPQGRLLFAVFALLAAMQRVASGAHYVSDTLAGAAIGSLVAAALLGRGRLAARFSRLEETATHSG